MWCKLKILPVKSLVKGEVPSEVAWSICTCKHCSHSLPSTIRREGLSLFETVNIYLISGSKNIHCDKKKYTALEEFESPWSLWENDRGVYFRQWNPRATTQVSLISIWCSRNLKGVIAKERKRTMLIIFSYRLQFRLLLLLALRWVWASIRKNICVSRNLLEIHWSALYAKLLWSQCASAPWNDLF